MTFIKFKLIFSEILTKYLTKESEKVNKNSQKARRFIIEHLSIKRITGYCKLLLLRYAELQKFSITEADSFFHKRERFYEDKPIFF